MAANQTNTILQQQSLALLDAQLKPAILALILSVVAVITNTLLMAVIVKSKELHNKSQFIIFSHTLTEMLYGLFSLMNCGRKLYFSLLRIPDLVTRWNCLLFLMPFTTCNKAALMAILMLVTDRLLAISIPIAYKKLPPVRYVLCLNMLFWLANLIQVSIYFIGMDYTIIPICQFGLAVSPNIFSIDTIGGNVITGITIAAYALAIGIVGYRYWRKRWNSMADRTSWSRQIQLAAFKMMMAVGCIYLGSWGVVQTARYLIALTGSTNSSFYGSINLVLSLMNTSSHIFVYYGLSKTFRQACKKTFSRRSAVGPV